MGPTQAERRRMISFLGVGDQWQKKAGFSPQNIDTTKRARRWLIAVCLALYGLGIWGILREFPLL